jgi:small multidrug resistance family-3 protein
MTLHILKTTGLFALTALAEILGCYSVYLWLRLDRSFLWLLPAAAFLAAFAWLLTLHPAATGRTYAAYGGIYIAMSVLWLWQFEKITPTAWDLLGVGLCLAGVIIIVASPR